MASVELQTVTSSTPFVHAPGLVRAGSRYYAIYADGTNLVYKYSDDNMATWSSSVTIATGSANNKPAAVYDATNGRLNICYAGGNSTSTSLRFRAITTNVASGVPGALTTEQTIDAGGTNLGVIYPYIVHSDTATNPRYWIVAFKVTAASTYETRAWFVAAGSAADTAANWSTTNFTNVFANSSSNTQRGAAAAFWTASGSPKLTIVSFGTSGVQMKSVTFDPSAATPTPGTITTFGTAPTSVDIFANGPMIAAAGVTDACVMCYTDTSGSGTVAFYSTSDGTTWTALTSGSVTGGRCSLGVSAAGDVYAVHTDTYGAIGTTAQTLSSRKIASPYTTLGAASAFSDTAGNPVSVAISLGSSLLACLYRGSTASPYTLRSDSVSIAAAAPAAGPRDLLLLGAG
ncbi:hypothetical protein Gocc_2915 [Gaiella occulta]|uniref:Exo-alpha-sialidase n=1 Tax=Gaiella occulta TaxID=1002870 RepID=A0A7M2YTG2_9ACTN|nr:sialidase family protein [Gaiella occulta]RDI73315.1 hypothetical protein Gocc_2915 [Gaiella occulta]